MPRAKKSFKARRRRNRVLKAIKGYRGKRGRCYAVGSEALHHSWQHMYRHRKQRKRDFRRLWVVRINAACRQLGTSYSRVMGALIKADVQINRKMLSELAIHDPATFKAVIDSVAGAAVAERAAS